MLPQPQNRPRRRRLTDVVEVDSEAVEVPNKGERRCPTRFYPVRGMLIAHEGYLGHEEMSVPLHRK